MGLQPNEFWDFLHERQHEKGWDNIILLIELCLCTPFSNATLEHFISQMKVIKTDWLIFGRKRVGGGGCMFSALLIIFVKFFIFFINFPPFTYFYFSLCYSTGKDHMFLDIFTTKSKKVVLERENLFCAPGNQNGSMANLFTTSSMGNHFW